MILRICMYCGRGAIVKSDLLYFSPNNNSKYGRRNLCKLCETTIKTAKNNKVPLGIYGRHEKIRFPCRHGCKTCDTVATFGYMVATLFRTDSRHTSGYKRICKECEAKGRVKEVEDE